MRLASLRLVSSLIALITSASASALSSRQTTVCNNSPDLCSRPYNSITHLGAHDSPFVRDASTAYSTSGNQYYNSTVQLSAGVRLLTAQVHSSNGDWHLCHSSCDLLDAGVLSVWLSDIKAWLDANPDDVVTILLVNSDNATPSDLAAEFTTSGITPYAYIPPSYTSAPSEWPTLQTLITANTRLLTFVASLSTSTITSSTSYLMDEFTFIFENPFQVDSLSAFSCVPDRPSSVQGDITGAISSNRMALMNHFLDESGLFNIETPDVANITITNSPGTSVGNLGFSLETCQSQYGKAPTFVLVDFFDQGPAIEAVDSLNGVTNPVGRTLVPARNTGGGRSAASFAGVVELVAEIKLGQKPSFGAFVWAAGRWSWGGINLSGGKLLE